MNGCPKFLRGALLSAALIAQVQAQAATKTVDLDANAANGAESTCELNVITPFPVEVQNTVTNKAVGDSFTFSWFSAGPGGFTSSVTPGTSGGVGATWSWTTNQSVEAFTGQTCDKDICFTKTGGPDAMSNFCSTACLLDGASLTVVKGAGGSVTLNWTGGQPNFTIYRSSNKKGVAQPANVIGTTSGQTAADTPPDNLDFYVVRGVDCTTRKSCTLDSDCNIPGDGTCVSRGPFGVPGRTQVTGDVTVSAGSLTSSLITFFSPPQKIFEAKSIAGGGGSAESVTNFGTTPVTVTTPGYPPGCCPANPDVPHQIRCGDVCVDYLNDTNNCGACGHICAADECCTEGVCELVCAPGLTFCNGVCVDLQSDDGNCGACGNACGSDACCHEGACAPICPEGQILCGSQCVDIMNDSDHCGACDYACPYQKCCDKGLCFDRCLEGQYYCNGLCVDAQNDSSNCGACGVVCGAGTCCGSGDCQSECDPGFTYCNGQCIDLTHNPLNCGACGNSCGGNPDDECKDGICVKEDSRDHTGDAPPVAPVCFNSHPTVPMPDQCPNPNPTTPHDSVCGKSAAVRGTGVAPSCPKLPPPDTSGDAPVCIINQTTQTLQPGETATTCTPGGVIFKEVPTAIKVCGDGLPGVNGPCNDTTSKVTTGTFNRLVSDTSVVIGDAYVTPLAVHVVSDNSNDGLIQPGESAGLIIDVVNAGPLNITNAQGTLSAPAVDLTDDGVNNPVGITVGGGSISFGTIFGTPVSSECIAPTPHPASNSTVFPITVPFAHPGDTSHPFVLAITGTVGESPFSMNVPLSLGISGACDISAHSGGYDGLDGLANPMSKLVPVGDVIPFPSKSFTAGNTRPMKLRMSCGGTNLSDGMVTAPEIVALSEATRGPLDIHALNLNSDNGTNPNDPFFRFNNTLSGGQWVYNMRTSIIGAGTYTLTIRIAGRKNYVTGFVLQ